MRLVLDARTATDHFPGIGRYVANLARALPRVAPELDLRLLVDPAAISTRLALPHALPRAHCRASPFSPGQQWRVPAALRRERATFYHSAYYLMPYRPGVPAALTAYDVIPLLYPAYFSAAQRLIFYWAHRLALRAVRVTFAISQATRADLVRCFGVDPARVAVTPLAADPHFALRPADDVQAVRRRLGLPDRYVLYHGSNKPHKNLERLVGAFAQAAKHLSGSAPSLVIAGHWDARFPEARRRVEEAGWLDRVRFLGPVAEADLPALYQGATLFVFPSRYEGFGLPVLEAMACGAPVACSKASSLAEVAEGAALLFDPQDEAALADTMVTALRDAALREALRARGLARAAQFSWDRTARLTLEAIAAVQG